MTCFEEKGLTKEYIDVVQDIYDGILSLDYN